MTTTIERSILMFTVIMLGIGLGCGLLVYKSTKDCQGLEGVVDAVWTGVSCTQPNKGDTS